MNLIMLRTILRQQRFHAYCQSASQCGNTRLSSILQTLVPHVTAIPACSSITASGEIEKLYETHSNLIPPEIYNALLAYINLTVTEQFHHCAALPHTSPR